MVERVTKQERVLTLLSQPEGASIEVINPQDFRVLTLTGYTF
jgi:hypothetical protein